jgi:hypothetical protein
MVSRIPVYFTPRCNSRNAATILYNFTPLKTPFGLLIPLLQSSPTRNIHSQLFITLCHIYTAYNVTRSQSLFCHTVFLTHLTSSHFPCLSPIETSLVEQLLNNCLRRHSSSSYKTLNRTSVTAATSQVRAVLRHSRKREGHVIFPYSCCCVTSPRHVA